MSASAAEPALVLEKLRRAWGEDVAVDGLSLSVERGQIYGLIGPDAAGKTTTLRMVVGLLRAGSGHVRTLGLDPIAESRTLRSRIGYMPQRFSLYPDLSVEENLRFFARMYHVSRADYEERVPELYRFSRLGEFRRRRAGALSGGMKQKLALICTLIHTPELLVLDEPTFGVDPVSRVEFWQILARLREQGLALLVSTAYMDEAQLCDRLTLLHEGRAIASGPPSELAESFPHRLVELRSPQLEQARRALLPLADQSVDVHRFGDALHLVYDRDEQRESIDQALEGIEAEMEAIEPSIEDLFVSLLREQTQSEEPVDG